MLRDLKTPIEVPVKTINAYKIDRIIVDYNGGDFPKVQLTKVFGTKDGDTFIKDEGSLPQEIYIQSNVDITKFFDLEGYENALEAEAVEIAEKKAKEEAEIKAIKASMDTLVAADPANVEVVQ